MSPTDAVLHTALKHSTRWTGSIAAAHIKYLHMAGKLIAMLFLFPPPSPTWSWDNCDDTVAAQEDKGKACTE